MISEPINMVFAAFFKWLYVKKHILDFNSTILQIKSSNNIMNSFEKLHNQTSEYLTIQKEIWNELTSRHSSHNILIWLKINITFRNIFLLHKCLKFNNFC